jgi:pimeloyl-ACP methyl ester carboxylesterase
MDTGEIQLHVAVARSISDDPQPDPLIVLSGGPGSWALEWTYWNLSRYDDILQERDVIFFDPRGVGYSNPSLDCPEVMAAFNEIRGRAHTAHEWAESISEAHLVCRERLLGDGIDLSAYNSAEMAADVNDLRAAMGYDKVNLFGVSYGTRTALTVMRDYPLIVRSVVLDSAIPLEVNLLGEDAAGASQSLNLLFERCAEDSDCNAAYPDLESDFEKLAERLDANPITIPVTHLVTNKRHEVWVEGSILGAAVLEALYNYETLVTVPQLIYETLHAQEERGPSSAYKALATSLEIFLFYGDYASEGMRQSVLCSDEGSFSTLDSALQETATAHPAIAAYVNRDLEATLGICDGWGAKVAEPLENEPVFSEIPTLVLAGEYDPVTPPAFGRQVADTLANATYVEFPGLGHYVFADRECARDIMADFLSNPHTPPDLGCIDKIQFHFVVKP